MPSSANSCGRIASGSTNIRLFFASTTMSGHMATSAAPEAMTNRNAAATSASISHNRPRVAPSRVE